MNPAISALLSGAAHILELLIAAVGGAWLGGKANRKNNVALARDISTNQSEVDERLEGIRAQLQQNTQNSTFYARRQHLVYAKLFRLFHVADGMLCGRAGIRFVPAIDSMDRAELAELANAHELAATVRDKVLRLWDSGTQQDAREELRAAIKRSEEAGGMAAFTEAKNFAIVNALYLSPSIEAEVQGLVQTLATYSAEITFPEPGRYKQRSDLASDVGVRLGRLRESMRRELQGGALAVSARTNDP